ncbi:uncharacterized protein LOC126660819 [Mercurialis annua]|uniref:uncharacterized protein LOC126660819 n=1 Tax=Mercurialis annua TaxID=3986 RepID=UPI00215FF08C|nr:uncharacterized protein LOC126660819 [Mercurialis annua]
MHVCVSIKMTSLCRGQLVLARRASPETFTSIFNTSSKFLYNSPSLHFKRFIPLTTSLSSPIISMAQKQTAAGISAGANNGGGCDNGAVFPLSASTILKIIQGDITKWSVDGSSDAIVNPANNRMLGGGGADGAIHRAAGPELLNACCKVPEVERGIRCPVGEARITLGFKLPASHVIHTVGPIYDADRNPAASLTNAYRNSLALAKENNIKFIAFPAISCGIYGYPLEEAASVSISAIKEFAEGLKEVHFVLFSEDILDVWLKAAKELLLP